TQAISFAMSNVSIKMCPPCLRTPVHHVSGTYRERARVRGSCFNALKPEFDAVFHVGVHLPNTTVSPLSLRERARVRGCDLKCV
ncbi:hypothetical protein, partial [Pseudomonas helmanticensis]|uniref:hypothetical protein n=1 Tax=Pseudomonas helmanticensis TaxID=1471381 RepID=UPI00382A02E0